MSVYQFYVELNQRSLVLEEIHFFKSHFEKSRLERDPQKWELFNMLYKSKMIHTHEVIYMVLFTKIMNFEYNSHEHNNHKSCDKLINTKLAYYILPTYMHGFFCQVFKSSTCKCLIYYDISIHHTLISCRPTRAQTPL